MIFGVIHNTLQMQPYVISFYGVTSKDQVYNSYVRHPRCVLYNRLVMLVRGTYVSNTTVLLVIIGGSCSCNLL